VNRSVAAGQRNEPILDDRQGAEPGALRLLHHPEERHVAEALVRIAAADIGVHAGEPHLFQPPLLDFVGLDQLRFVHLVPQQRVERVALVVNREGMPSAQDAFVQLVVGHAERVDPVVDRPRDLSDRSTVCGDGIPDADEADRRSAIVGRIVDVAALETVDPSANRGAGAPKQPRRPLEPAWQKGGAERLVRGAALAIEFGFTAGAHQPFRRDERNHEAHGERAAAEPEGVDVVAVPVIAARIAINIQDVSLEAPAERAAEQGQRLEG
jgi:hypothetical protein